MITIDAIPAVLGHTVYDSSHNKLGKIGQVYVDETTGQPEWMTVNTGLFGTKETFVPLEPAQVQGDEVMVPFQKERSAISPAGGEVALAPQCEYTLPRARGTSVRFKGSGCLAPVPEVDSGSSRYAALLCEALPNEESRPR